MKPFKTDSDLAAYMAKANRGWSEEEFKSEGNDTPDEGKEAVLQGRIVAWAKERALPCVNFRQSRKALGFLTPGTPDIILALPGGQVLWLELKSSTGSLREDQKLMAQKLLYLGHKWFEIRSFRRFLEIVEGPQ